MGKSRKTRNQTTPVTPNEPSKNIIEQMRRWQGAMYSTPEGGLTEKEIQFVKDHMKIADEKSGVMTGQLTRVEKAHHFTDLNLKEGDILDTKSVFRAFSREPDATMQYMWDHYRPSRPLVIYRTSGKVPHYNITEKTKIWKEEKESWVETGKLRIDKITHYTSDKDDMKQVMIDNMHLDKYPGVIDTLTNGNSYGENVVPHDIIFVDVSPAG